MGVAKKGIKKPSFGKSKRGFYDIGFYGGLPGGEYALQLWVNGFFVNPTYRSPKSWVAKQQATQPTRLMG